LTRSDLPDVREVHHALVYSGEQRGAHAVERDALVNVETDRVTNSLNTLSEELLRWLAETGAHTGPGDGSPFRYLG